MVIDKTITNQSLRKLLCNIPIIWDQIAKRQLTFIGKIVRTSEDQIPTMLLSELCDNKHKRSAPLQNNKQSTSVEM